MVSHTVLQTKPLEKDAALGVFSRAVDTTDTGELFVLYAPRYLQNDFQLSKFSVFIFTVSFAFTFFVTSRVTCQQGDWSDEPLTSVLSDTGGG